jgi:hypothetical protein
VGDELAPFLFFFGTSLWVMGFSVLWSARDTVVRFQSFCLHMGYSGSLVMAFGVASLTVQALQSMTGLTIMAFMASFLSFGRSNSMLVEV